MDKTYRDYLQRQFDEAQAAFEEAKKNAIRDLENMNAWNAADFGAAYFTKIDKVTQQGQKVMTIAQAMQAYDYMMTKEDK